MSTEVSGVISKAVNEGIQVGWMDVDDMVFYFSTAWEWIRVGGRPHYDYQSHARRGLCEYKLYKYENAVLYFQYFMIMVDLNVGPYALALMYWWTIKYKLSFSILSITDLFHSPNGRRS